MKTYFFILFSVFCLLINITLLAQEPRKKFKKGGVTKLQDSLTSYGQSDIFSFPNINKVKHYQDAEKLKHIHRLQASYADHELYTELRNYVKNFGIENFSANINMIWKLAQLSQEYGPPGESLLLYKMVLKHNRRSVDGKLVQSEYDSITKNIKDHYVPLDYYYELVNYRKEIDTLQPPHGVLLNMGDWINSTKADYAPTIGNIDTLLLFTSKRNSNLQSIEKTYNEDIFFTTKFSGQWMEAQPFKEINTRYNEGSACLSKDGKFLFFAKCNSPDSYGNCDIFVSERRTDNTWGHPHNLGKDVNTVSWDSHPSLSHSGDTLFFASDRIGGFGLADIYYTVKNEQGIWGSVQNIGPIVNTRGNDLSPFYHHKFNVLYFSSNGQPVNFGDFDIYKSYKIKNEWGEPKNIGPLVNGVGTEYYFTIDSESSQLYYARSAEDEINNLDLNSFPVPMEAQPEAIAKLKGTLINSETKKPMKGIVSVIDLDKGVEVAPKFIREDGSFDFSLINKRNYLLIIQGDDFFRIEEIFFMDGDMEINKETEPIESKIAFRSVEFENGKADILPTMHSDMDKLANFMIDHPKFKLNISGHTDGQGKEDSNLRLSQARADAIKAYLIYQYKIDAARIDAHGYGSSKPIVQEESDDHRKLNRRVEFDIMKE